LIPYRVMRRTEVRPYATYSILAICVGVFLWELTIPDAKLFATFTDIAITSCQLTLQWFSPKTWLDILRSMFLHGGWSHLIGNMLFLVIFGPAVEEYFGHRRFVAFYILAGVAAAISQIIVNAATRDLMCAVLPPVNPTLFNPPTAGWIPMIGASGAISGLIAGFLLLHPGVKVRAMIPLFRGIGPVVDVPSWIAIGIWISLQLISGFAALAPGFRSGVAFWAHIGGFIFGAAAVFIATTFVPAPPQRIIED
jgi:uncharacterized protein